MVYMILVFAHLLSAAMALGAIVATDLRMLSKLGHDKVRIPPPNEFVARLVSIALVLLYITGAGVVILGSGGQPEYFTNPKLQAKLLLVFLLTVNAFVLHRITFPRLARGRSVGRWGFADWVLIVPPVALSNCLWMFCAFLGIARPWNNTISVTEVLQVAGGLYLFALVVVGIVLAAASRPRSQDRPDGFVAVMKRSLAKVGNLGKEEEGPQDSRPHRPRSTQPPLSRYPAGVTPLAPPASVVLRGAWSAGGQRRRA
jgi:hypothetical protein